MELKLALWLTLRFGGVHLPQGFCHSVAVWLFSGESGLIPMCPTFRLRLCFCHVISLGPSGTECWSFGLMFWAAWLVGDLYSN